MIELPEGIEIEKVSVDKKYKSVTSGLTRRIKILYEAIFNKYGEDGLELIREVSSQYGEEIARRAKTRIEKGDLKSVALYVIRVFNTLRGQGKVVEFSHQRVVIRVWECPYGWETPEICRAHTQMEKALVELLGESLRYRISRSIPRGDAYCDHVIEIRRAGKE